MKLMTLPIRKALEANRAKVEADEDFDPKPVLKLFAPWGAATWLLTEFDSESGVFFGLCDLGMGTPEIGYVALSELEGLRGPAGLRVERDRYFKADKTLTEYAKKARAEGGIIT